MKEAYFLEDNIQEVAGELLQKVIGYHRRDVPLLMPRKSALVVLDMQDYFVDESSHAYIPSVEAIIPGIQGLIRAYQQKDLPVIFTRHINTEENAGMLKSWWSDLITEDNPLSEIASALHYKDAIVLRKSQYDAFYNTGLDDILKNQSVEHVLVCGVMTHLCCETTARSAFIHGYNVWFAVDGTATYNEDFHRATLLNLSHGFVTPVLVDEVLAVIRDDE
jgi:nicotinamidase-related amidase